MDETGEAEVSKQSSRRRFLRQLGVTLGVGLGVVMPAAKASAKTLASQCCYRPDLCSCPNPDFPYPYRCTDTCCGQGCCFCVDTYLGNCVTAGCPCCP